MSTTYPTSFVTRGFIPGQAALVAESPEEEYTIEDAVRRAERLCEDAFKWCKEGGISHYYCGIKIYGKVVWHESISKNSTKYAR